MYLHLQNTLETSGIRIAVYTYEATDATLQAGLVH